MSEKFFDTDGIGVDLSSSSSNDVMVKLFKLLRSFPSKELSDTTKELVELIFVAKKFKSDLFFVLQLFLFIHSVLITELEGTKLAHFRNYSTLK